jgi:hypothetical protein
VTGFTRPVCIREPYTAKQNVRTATPESRLSQLNQSSTCQTRPSAQNTILSASDKQRLLSPTFFSRDTGMPTRRGVGILPRPGPLDAPVKLETPATPPTQTTRPPGMQEDTPQSPGRSGLRASTVSHAGTPARAGNRLLAEPFLSPLKSPSPVKRQAPSEDEEDFSPASSEAESSSGGEWSRGSNSGRRGAAKRRCRGPGAPRVAVKLEQEDGDDEWNDKEAKRASGSRICSWRDKNGAECGKSFSRNVSPPLTSAGLGDQLLTLAAFHPRPSSTDT